LLTKAAKGTPRGVANLALGTIRDTYSGSMSVNEPRIVLLGRPGCHLCEDARDVVQRVAEDLGVGWEERSIDDDPDLLERYAEQIPVTLVDGRQHDFWRVDEARLRSALT
jgi:hypothetical protein